MKQRRMNFDNARAHLDLLRQNAPKIDAASFMADFDKELGAALEIAAQRQRRRDLGKPRESWLRSEDPEQWAEAMMRCRPGGDGRCGDDGFCHLADDEWSCFKPERSGVRLDGKEVERMTLREMRRAVVEMDQRHRERLEELLGKLLKQQDELISLRRQVGVETIGSKA